MKKIFNFAITAFLAVTLCFAVAGCDNGPKAEDLLKTFLLEEDGQSLTSDFTVNASIKSGENEYQINWSSDNECVKVASEAEEDASGLKKYKVSVTRPDTKQTVKLSATLSITKKNTATKDFTIYVNPIDVFDFSGNYNFKQEKTVVSKDFALDTEFNYAGKKCTMTWSSSNESLIKISEDGKTALVTEITMETPVTLSCTYSYNGQTTTKTYSVTVYYNMTRMDSIAYWYTHTNVSQVLSGYIVEIGAAYDASYGNVTLYVLDDDLNAGYYLYRVKMTEAEAAQIEIGAHITATGTTNTNYNGLMETNAGGTAVIDENVEKINVNDVRKAIDLDLIANAQDLYYRQSTPVSLTNWKIKTVNSELSFSSNPVTLLTLEKDGVTASIVYSKYIASTPLDANSDAAKAIVAVLAELKAGDYVNVKGILSYYNSGKTQFDQKSYQIVVTGADSITKGTEDTTTGVGLSEIAKVIAQIKLPSAVYSEKEITLLASTEKVEITWGFAAVTPLSAKIENGKLVVKPTNMGETIMLEATLKVGEYETKVRYNITSLAVSDAEKTKTEIKDVVLDEVYGGSVTLPAKGTTFDDVTFTYEITNDGDGVVTIDAKKNNVLVFGKVDAFVEVNVKVTATCGEETATKTLRIAVKPLKPVSVADAIAKDVNEAVAVTGTVSAVGSRGFVLNDGTNGIYVYFNESADQTACKTYVVGDVVTVYAIRGEYSGAQLVPFASEKVEGATASTEPTAKEYTGAMMDTYVSGKSFATEYVTITGTLSVSGNYFNVNNIEGATKAIGSITYPNTTLANAIKEYNGKEVTVTGWVISVSSGKYFNILAKEVVCEEAPVEPDAPEVVKLGEITLTSTNQTILVEGLVIGVGTTVYYLYDGTGYIMVNAYNSSVDATIPNVGDVVKVSLSAYASYGQAVGKPQDVRTQGTANITAPSVTAKDMSTVTSSDDLDGMIFTITGTYNAETSYFVANGVNVVLHKNNSLTEKYNAATASNTEVTLKVAFVSYHSGKSAWQVAVLDIVE